mgnify:FL=1
MIEIVSNRKGGEKARKFQEYARQHIPYYAVFDPTQKLRGEILHFALHQSSYRPLNDFWMEDIHLGLRLWEGTYEGTKATWLRWCDDRENLIPTTAESRDNEKSRADRLAEKLRELGINPDE